MRPKSQKLSLASKSLHFLKLCETNANERKTVSHEIYTCTDYMDPISEFIGFIEMTILPAVQSSNHCKIGASPPVHITRKCHTIRALDKKVELKTNQEIKPLKTLTTCRSSSQLSFTSHAVVIVVNAITAS